MDDFTKRDTAVIPWLPLYSRPTVAKPKRPCKIISLLGARERIGLKSNCTRTGSLSEGVLVSNEELSGAGAWNRRRMQNMILAVGPGTPASCVLTSVGTAGTGIDSDSNDEDDIYHADTDGDEVEMLESDDEDENLEGEENNDVMIADDEDMLSDSNSELEIVAEVTDTAQDGQEDELPRDKKSGNNSDDDRVEAEAEIARLLAARPVEDHDRQCDLEGQCDDNKESSRRCAWTRRQEDAQKALHGEGSDTENDEDEESHVSNNHTDSGNENSSIDSDSDESRAQQRAVQVRDFLDHQIRRQIQRRRRSQLPFYYPTSDNSQSSHHEREVARSMKHNGCINTVSWLDCGWRISTVSHEDVHPYSEYYNDIFASSSHSSNVYCSTPMRHKQSDGLAVPMNASEYPTQLITSGDDHVVKIWDVSCAMGSVSPLPGGSATVAPFCSEKIPMKPTSELLSKWKSHAWLIKDDHDGIDMKYKHHLPGIVHPLLCLATGHRGNVFDATAIPNSPGKLLTCAADGTVRMTDVHINATSSPAARNRGRSNSISSASIAAEASTTILSPEFHSENGESNFRNNSLMCFSQHFLNETVGLVCSERGLLHFDLRLPPRSQRRGSMIEELSATCKSCCVWKEYNENSDSAYVFAGGSGSDVGLYDLRMTGRPSSQAVQKYRPRPLRRKSTVSISGIEVSRDKKELLVAYESDQCYTFPIFPQNASSVDPTISDIHASTEDLSNGAKPISELAQYGAHLNRLTFLKVARYAGPNDEYICTGSDSGHAWIYDKATGSVAAFLRADNSTCNGILPHPSLPYFVTYGIDSTAKLWRATLPVDDKLDDSDSGRFAYTRKEQYKKSVVVDKWIAGRKGKHVDLDSEDIPFLPDETPEENGLEDSFPLGFMGLLFSRSLSTSDPPYIGNDLMSLSNEIKKNFYTCARAGLGEDVAVKSSLAGLKTRMSLMKLRHHADRLGLQWDCNVPWNMSFIYRAHDTAMKDEKPKVFADLIPEPTDWMPFNVLMANPPLDCEHNNFYYRSYTDVSLHPVRRANIPIHDQIMLQEKKCSRVQINLDNNLVEEGSLIEYDSIRNWDILYSTIALLKEAGNAAVKQSLNCLAASYYDKAILYCSLSYMEFPVGNIEFLAQHQVALSENSGWECRWTLMLKTFLQIRLNMSLCLLKSDVNDIKGAVFQAKMALKELRPFVAQKGRVMTGKKLNRSRLEEPETTYNEAIVLQSKAYYRLGSAQLLLGDFEDAIESFERSIKSSGVSDPEKKPDSLVLRKLQEAKLASRRHCNSERKKFKFAFASKDHDHLQ